MQQAVRRYEDSGRLLSRRELSQIIPFRSSLVLNSMERYLLEASQEAAGNSRGKTVTVISSAAAVLLILVTFFLFQLNDDPRPVPVSLTLEENRPSAALVHHSDASGAKVDREDQYPAIARESAPVEQDALPADESREEDAEPARMEAGALIDATELSDHPAQQQISSVAETAGRQTDKSLTSSREVSGQQKDTAPDAGPKLQLEYDQVFPLPSQPDHYVIEKDGRQGLAKENGEIIVYPYFKEVRAYYPKEKLLVVINNGKAGVYDERGQRFAIGLEYQDICCLSEGLFGVQIENGKWGFIDRWGNKVIPAIYDAIEEPFKNSRAIVRENGKKVTIDLSGNSIALNDL